MTCKNESTCSLPENTRPLTKQSKYVIDHSSDSLFNIVRDKPTL